MHACMRACTRRGQALVLDRIARELHRDQRRVMDLFRDWDHDGDGCVDQYEFRTAMKVPAAPTTRRVHP